MLLKKSGAIKRNQPTSGNKTSRGLSGKAAPMDGLCPWLKDVQESIAIAKENEWGLRPFLGGDVLEHC